MADGAGPNGIGSEPIPTLALCGKFMDFDLLPTLVSQLNRTTSEDAVSQWAGLLDEVGFDARHIDPDGGRPASTIAAEGAWRLANRISLVRGGRASDAGQAVAKLAGIDAEARQRAQPPLLGPLVESALAGEGGRPIIPPLTRAAQALAASTSQWALVCPALIPIEVGTIVHWAGVDFAHAESVVADIVTNRGAATPRSGLLDSDTPMELAREHLFLGVAMRYTKHAHLGRNVSFSLGEELALTKLLRCCGLFGGSGPRGGTLLPDGGLRCPRAVATTRTERWAMTDPTDLDDFHRDEDHMWRPVECHGWTWVQTMGGAPELYSLFDADGELMGEVYQRFNRVICWAPFTWAEEAYRSEEDVED